MTKIPLSDEFLASGFDPRPVIWEWQDRIPRGFITVVAGRPGAGKSLLSALLSSHYSKRRRNVILSAAENPRHEVTVPRLLAAGADLQRVALRRFTFPACLDDGSFEEAVVAGNVDLVVVDPLAAHLAGVSRFSDSVRKVTTPLGDIAARTGCAIVLIEHVLKKVGQHTHPLQAISGSGSGVAAAAQMVYVMGKDPDDDERIVMCSAKSNLRDDPRGLEFRLDSVDDSFGGSQGVLLKVGECDFKASRLLAGDGDKKGAKPTKMQAAHEWLCMYLLAAPDHTMRARDVREDAQQHGHSRKTLDRAAADMMIVKSDDGPQTRWTLPKGLADALGGDDE